MTSPSHTPGHTPSISPAERLWQLWQSGQGPRLDEFLASLGQQSSLDLLALVRIDQQNRWQRGERVLAESYFAPPLSLPPTDDLLVDVINSEVLLRDEHGEPPSVPEFVARFPQLRDKIERLFVLHDALAEEEAAVDPNETQIHRGATDFVHGGNGDQRAADRRPKAALKPGEVIGEYLLLSQLGEGGMGVVFRAEHLKLRRQVALKLLWQGAAADREVLRRFRAEAEIVASISHPGIIQIYEVGEHDDQLFLSLELAEGGSLATRLEDELLPPLEAARMVKELASAMQAAHERGVVHRDLKPANVLLSRGGTAKITDFGLAKQIDSVVARGGTVDGDLLGTPFYMAPEQAEGRNQDVGPHSDVYALGAVLYETLTGRPPLRGSSFFDTLQQVRTREPVAPSTLQPKIPRDLDTICLKCLQKEPERRYATAKDLADDLQRFLDGEPIAARPVPGWERAVKWARRRPAVAALVAVSFAATLAIFVGTLIYSRELQDALGLAKQREGEAETQRTRAQKSLVETERSLFNSQVSQATLNAFRDPVVAARSLDDPERMPAELRDFTWRYVRRLCQWQAGEPIEHKEQVSEGQAYKLTCMVAARDCSWVMTGDNQGRLVRTRFGEGSPTPKVLPAPPIKLKSDAIYEDEITGEPRKRLEDNYVERAQEVLGLAMSPDGDKVAAALFGGQIRVVNADLEDPDVWETGDEFLRAIVFVDQNRLAVCGGGNTIQIWNIAAQKKEKSLEGPVKNVSLAYSRSEQLLITAGSDGAVYLFKLAGGERPDKLPFQGALANRRVVGVATDPAGGQLAMITDDRATIVWDLREQRVTAVLVGHALPIRHVCFSADGRLLASAGEEGTVRLWYLDNGRDPTVLRLAGDLASVENVQIHDAGETFFSASVNGVIRRWRSPIGREAQVLTGTEQGSPGNCIAISPDGELIATGGHPFVEVWQPALGRQVAARLSPRIDPDNLSQIAAVQPDKSVESIASASPVTGVAFLAGESADDYQLASLDADGVLCLWDRKTFDRRDALVVGGEQSSRLTAVAGGNFATTDDVAERIRIWNTKDRSTIDSLPPDDTIVAVPPILRRREFAWADVKGQIVVHRADEQRRTIVKTDHTTISAMALHPKLDVAVVGCRDSTASAWDLKEHRRISILDGHAGSVRSIVFSPDGRTLATASGEGTIRLWDPISFQLRATIDVRGSDISAIAFDPRGRYLAAACADGRVRLWYAGE